MARRLSQTVPTEVGGFFCSRTQPTHPQCLTPPMNPRGLRQKANQAPAPQMPALAGESPPNRNPLTPPALKSTTCNVENDNNTKSPGPTMSRSAVEYTLIDLFSGAGGFTHGFKEAGFKPILAVEKEQDFADTYEENFGAHVIRDDIAAIVKAGGIKKKADVVIGGPPCQGFSNLTGNRKTDPRRAMWQFFMDVVKESECKVFVIENVPNLLKSSEGEAIIARARELGFIISDDSFGILNASKFGVPQDRPRAFIVGSKLGPVALPKPSGRVSVVAGANAGFTRDVVAFLRQAEQPGCSGVVLVALLFTSDARRTGPPRPRRQRPHRHPHHALQLSGPDGNGHSARIHRSPGAADARTLSNTFPSSLLRDSRFVLPAREGIVHPRKCARIACQGFTDLNQRRTFILILEANYGADLWNEFNTKMN